MSGIALLFERPFSVGVWLVVGGVVGALIQGFRRAAFSNEAGIGSAAIAHSTTQTDNAPFVEFMLGMIRDTLEQHISPQAAPQVTPQVKQLIQIMLEATTALSAIELQQALKLNDRKSFRTRYLKPALAQGLVNYTMPEKPTSPLQRYVLTEKGRLIQ
jgi:hypothetical protein